MLIELARSRQAELLANVRKIETMAAFEQLSRAERLQDSLRAVRARLGLLPAKAG